jgi:hypothetical protein
MGSQAPGNCKNTVGMSETMTAQRHCSRSAHAWCCPPTRQRRRPAPPASSAIVGARPLQRPCDLCCHLQRCEERSDPCHPRRRPSVGVPATVRASSRARGASLTWARVPLVAGKIPRATREFPSKNRNAELRLVRPATCNPPRPAAQQGVPGWAAGQTPVCAVAVRPPSQN